MPTYPAAPRADFLQWCLSHKDVWSARAAQIGLPASLAAEFAARTDAAADALAALAAAEAAYRSKVVVAEQAFDLLRASAGTSVKFIRAFADASPSPIAVESLALIPPVARPGVAPPPGRPRALSASVEWTDGVIVLSWKCRQPRGTSGAVFVVRRRLSNTDPWSVIAVTGRKTFRDETFTAGPTSVEYCVSSRRGEVESESSNALLITFGRPSSHTQAAPHPGPHPGHRARAAA